MILMVFVLQTGLLDELGGLVQILLVVGDLGVIEHGNGGQDAGGGSAQASSP